jgi:predicted nucleic acid-binding protein
LAIADTGTLGIVLACRRANIIPAARPLIESLVAQGLRLAPELVAESLAEVGE